MHAHCNHANTTRPSSGTKAHMKPYGRANYKENITQCHVPQARGFLPPAPKGGSGTPRTQTRSKKSTDTKSLSGDFDKPNT